MTFPWHLLAKVIIAAAVFLLVYDLAVQLVYAHRVLPGVEIGDYDVSGKSATDVQSALGEREKELKTFSFTKDQTKVEITAQEIGLHFDAAETAVAAQRAGRQGIFDRLTHPIAVFFGHADQVPLRYGLVESAFKEKLAAKTPGLNNPARNATIYREGLDFRITPESSGTVVDPGANLLGLHRAIEGFQTSVPLYVRPQEPEIHAADLSQTRAYAHMLAATPMQVKADGQDFVAPPEVVAGWITFEARQATAGLPELMGANLLARVDQAFGIGQDDAPIVAANQKTLFAVANMTTIGQYVSQIADQVDHPPVNARVAWRDNHLVVTGKPQDGIVVDRPGAVRTLADSLKSEERRANLKLQTKHADIREDNVGTLGIKALIGSATTYFPGSPYTRIYNIGVGASKFDGVLIKPGETFSFDATLGDVGPETGYIPALVIKEKKTVPEYGGGLCQVSTTAFQAALKAGLPIVERTNHSYAVQYYSPLGMDATIYPPSPDLKFTNNTPGYILIQTHHEGTVLTFDFYGTPDGRHAETFLGEQNASTEAGGNASFHYIVAGGPDPIDQWFYSHYQPHKDFPVSNSFN